MHDENKIKLFIHKSLCSRIFTEVALTWFFSTFKNTTIKSIYTHSSVSNAYLKTLKKPFEKIISTSGISYFTHSSRGVTYMQANW